MSKKIIDFAVFVIKIALICIPLWGLPFIKEHIFNLTDTQRIQCLTGCILSLIWVIVFQIDKSKRQFQMHNFIAVLVIVFLFTPIFFSKYVLVSFFVFTLAQFYFVAIASVFETIKEVEKEIFKKISNDKEKKDE